MKSIPESELKNLATQPGPKQYLAFDELARRVRDDPSTWSGRNDWEPDLEWPRGPNPIEAEWVFLKLSRNLNRKGNYELKLEQDRRLDELQGHLNEDPDSLENKYYNAIVEKLHRQR